MSNDAHASPPSATLAAVLPPELIGRLLTCLQVSYAAEKLAHACRQVAGPKKPDGELPWLRDVLHRIRLSGVTLGQMPWRRFDRRYLPVLLQYEGQWHLAQQNEHGAILLTNAAGATKQATDDGLRDAHAIWLRVSIRPNSHRMAFWGNPAAQLVWRELFRESGWITKVVIATVLVNLLGVATSLFAMQVYDRVIPTLAYATLTTLVVGMGLILLVDWTLKTFRAHVLDSAASDIDKRVSQQVFQHLLHLRLDQQPRSLGTLAAQVNGLDSVRQFLSSSVVFSLVDLPFAVLFLAFIALIGGAVAWVYLLLLPVALMLAYVTQWRIRGLQRRLTVRSHERQGLLVDSIRGAESIRASNAGWRFAQDWQDITASLDNYGLQQKAVTNLLTVTTTSLSTVAYVAAIVVGVWQIEAGHLTMGGLIASSILGGRIIAPVAQSVQYLSQWQQVTQSLEMVRQLLALERERPQDRRLLAPEISTVSLELQKVRFTYAQSPVRQLDIDHLSFKAGERVLLLGPVGGGKSTLIKVLAGLYPPSEGRLRLGDVDLWEMDPQTVAAQIGYLPQAVHLFKGTLRSNVLLSGEISDSDFLRITRELGIDAIAAHSPQGFDHPISEGGDGLSGGQRQLVALARVIATQPRIWLFDEPTASLDRDSEAAVWKAIASFIRPDDILVVATHRPMQAMQLATRVVVVNQGKVTHDGRPENVLPQVFTATGARAVQSKEEIKGARFDVV